MVKPLFAGLALSTLVIAGNAVGCNALSRANKVIPQTNTATSVPESKTLQSTSLKALEQSIHQQVNQYRKSKNLPPLALDSRISAQARIHSQAMANGRVPFSHQGFEQRVSAIAKSISYHGAAENVAFNQGYKSPGQQAVQGWIQSKGHRENMEGQYGLTGIGVAKNANNEYYFTQIFIRR